MTIYLSKTCRNIIRTFPLIILAPFLFGFSHPPALAPEPIVFFRNADSKDIQPNEPLPDPLATIWKEKKPVLRGINLWSSSSAGRSNLQMPLKSAAVFLENETELLERTALVLIRELDLPELSTVNLYQPGQTLPPGAVKPDMFIRLRSESNNETNKVHLLAGNAYLDDIQPQWHDLIFFGGYWSMEAELTLSPSHPTKPPSTQVLGWKCGEELAKTVGKEINSIKDKCGVPPDFPESFVPDWQPAPKLAFLRDFDAREIVSTREPLTYNTTAWVFTSPDGPSNMLSNISALLQNEGWTEGRLYVSETSQILYAENRDEGYFLRIIDADDDMDMWLGGDIAERRAAGNKPYFVTFSHLMTHDESDPVLIPFFNGSPTPAQAIKIAMYKEKQNLPAKEMKPVLLVLRELAPAMSASDLFRLAKWVRYSTYPYEKEVRHYFVRSVLKNHWGDYNQELEKEQETWAKQKPYLEDLRPIRYLPSNLSAEEKREYGIRPLNEILGTKHTLSVGQPFAISVSTNQVQCWNVSRKEHSLMLRETGHTDHGYRYFYQSIEAGKTKEDEVDLEGTTYSVTTRTDSQGETWSIQITAPQPDTL